MSAGERAALAQAAKLLTTYKRAVLQEERAQDSAAAAAGQRGQRQAHKEILGLLRSREGDGEGLVRTRLSESLRDARIAIEAAEGVMALTAPGALYGRPAPQPAPDAGEVETRKVRQLAAWMDRLARASDEEAATAKGGPMPHTALAVEAEADDYRMIARLIRRFIPAPPVSEEV